MTLGGDEGQLMMTMNLGRDYSESIWPSSASRCRCKNNEMEYPGLRMCRTNMTNIYGI